jgi:hypothetical protein
LQFSAELVFGYQRILLWERYLGHAVELISRAHFTRENTVLRAKLGVIGLLVLLSGLTLGCKSASRTPDPSAVFFPLKPNMMWMYRVQSKSQQREYIVTDTVLGEQYVPALKLTGAVVEEFYNLDRAGLRPIVYTQKNGYLTRLSGLDYVKHQIKPPAWGRSIEEDFLPARLAPDTSWQNTLFPYGKLPGGFDVAQSHTSFMEGRVVVVPAGRYTGCIRIETLARYEGAAYSHYSHVLKLAYEDWYAPNVGLVRTIAYENDPDGPEMERVELIRFDAGVKHAAQPKPGPHAGS